VAVTTFQEAGHAVPEDKPNLNWYDRRCSRKLAGPFLSPGKTQSDSDVESWWCSCTLAQCKLYTESSCTGNDWDTCLLNSGGEILTQTHHVCRSHLGSRGKLDLWEQARREQCVWTGANHTRTHTKQTESASSYTRWGSGRPHSSNQSHPNRL
jgi:hypothetical protein